MDTEVNPYLCEQSHMVVVIAEHSRWVYLFDKRHARRVQAHMKVSPPHRAKIIRMADVFNQWVTIG
jgi:hypothetical protein